MGARVSCEYITKNGHACYSARSRTERGLLRLDIIWKARRLVLAMAEDPTEFFLPSSFPYPLTVVSLDAPVNAKVTRGTRLLSYSYVYHPKNNSERPSTRFGTWDATAEGDLIRWNVKEGDVVSSSEQAVVLILEPCKHGVQLGGLCALCGKDLTM